MSDETTYDQLPDEQRGLIDKILAAKQERGVTVTREFDGVPVTFHFQPSMNVPALRIVAKVQKLARMADADIMEQLEALMEFMDVMAFPADARMIAAMMETGALTVNDIADLQQEVVTAVAARPTTRSSSSASGLESPGESSTASSDLPAPTPAV